VTLTPINFAIMKFLLCVILLATIQGLAVNAAPALSRVDAGTSYNAVGAEKASRWMRTRAKKIRTFMPEQPENNVSGIYVQRVSNSC